MVPIQTCVAEASSAYHVEQARIAAIMANGLPAGVERGGRVGIMAIPEQWLPIFELMGIRHEDVLRDACQNIFAGTWILAYVASIQAEQSAAAGAYSARPVRVSAQMAERRRQWAPVVQRAAASTGIPAALIDAVITVESGYQPRAHSPANAIGMMQLLPSTAAMEGGDPWDAEQNIFMGARYLRQLALQFQGDLTLTLAAYNAGPAAVTRNGYRVPAFSETRAYCRRCWVFIWRSAMGNVLLLIRCSTGRLTCSVKGYAVEIPPVGCIAHFNALFSEPEAQISLHDCCRDTQ